MAKSKPSIVYTESEEVPDDTISLGQENASQIFPEAGFTNIEPQPFSLEPRRRSNSVDSKSSFVSEQNAVNPYFWNFEPTSSGLHPADTQATSPWRLTGGGTLTRTTNMLDKDWLAQRKSVREEIADKVIQVIKASRSKLTKLITDVTVLFPFLKEKVVLTPNDCDRIENKHLRSLQTDEFIDIIITRGPEGVAYFYESLKLHYIHIYITLKHIFEIKSIEIDSILDKSGRKRKGLSGYFCSSIEEILGPKVAQEKRDAQILLQSISAVKMDNMTSQDVQELKEKYIELQSHYEPIQNMIDTLTNDITTKYSDIQIKNEGLTYENEAALASIDKLFEENREIYEKMNTLQLKLMLQQEELDRSKMENQEGKNTAYFNQLLDLASSEEKFEMVKFHQKLEEEKNKNVQLNEQIEAIRIQKDELFDLKEKVLKENSDLKTELAVFAEQEKKKNNEDSRIKSNEYAQIKEANRTLVRQTKEIDNVLFKIGVRKPAINEITIKSTIPMSNIIKQHLSQSLEMGVFFSESLDQSLVKFFQPGDRLLRINNIKLSNMANTEFPRFMMQQAENSLKLLIGRGPVSAEKHPFVEHNFALTEDDALDISRCTSPNLDSNRLTPVPSTFDSHISLNMDVQRRTSTQSHTALSIQGGFTSLTHPLYENNMLTRTQAESFDLNSKEFLSSNFENDSGNVSLSCPQTPISNMSNNQPYLFKQQIGAKFNKCKNDNIISIASDSGSDTYSQDSDPPTIQRPPNCLHLRRDYPSNQPETQKYELVTSPTVAKEFPGQDNFDDVSNLFGSSRTDTGLTGMIIVTRSKPTVRASHSADDIALLLNKDQLRTTVPNELFLKYARISGGFGNPFFFSSSEELHQYKLKSGHKIHQINDQTTDYLTHEMFIDQCNLSSNITLFISLKPSPHFKPDEMSVRDHFYVIPHFTTKHITTKGELFISPSCVYLVRDTMVSRENTSKHNRYWRVTRVDPRNCKDIEEGVIPSDLWLRNLMESDASKYTISIDSQLSQGPRSLNSVFEDEGNLEHIGYYYDLDTVKKREENNLDNSLFKCYTLVSRQDILPQPVILFGYKWEEMSERLSRDSSENNKFQLITPTVIENVDPTKSAELEVKQKAGEIIYYKGTDGKFRFVNVKTLRDCADENCIPVLLCPIALIANAPGLVELNPIIIRLKFKYKYNSANKLDFPNEQRFHFDDMLRVGLSDEKYSKKLVTMINNNRVLHEWKSVVIEN